MAFGVIAVLFAATLPMQTTADDGDAHPAGACSAPYHVSHAGWDLCWQQDDPRAQGLELNQVYFQDESVLWKIGTPFSMTKYDNLFIGPFKDTLGSPGSGGHSGYGRGSMVIPPSHCPRFYSTGTLLNGGKLCVEERGGVEPALAIWARYDIYNYRFISGYKMDARGHVEPFVRMGGLLIDGNSGAQGNNHFHHLIWRADFDIGAAGGDEFQAFSRNTGAAPLSGTTTGGAGCETDGLGGTSAWCTVLAESVFHDNPQLATKWRVRDPADTNGMGRAKSYEVTVQGDYGADAFGTMDAMVVEYAGDSSELGYEVGTNPREGDKMLYTYLAGTGPITDPVVWIFNHVPHDTRDEDRGSMSYHEVRIEMQPHNVFATNPGEPTYP